MHVFLGIDERNGKPEFEPVHAEELTHRRYRLEFSPGLAYGIAAGDEFILQDNGEFEVVVRGLNLCVRVLSPSGVSAFEPALSKTVEGIGGRLDGQVKNGLTYTIPLTAGLAAVSSLFVLFTKEHAGSVWEYGNVYGESGTQLDWLLHAV